MYSVEQITAKLSETGKLQGQGLTIVQSCKKLGILGQTIFRCRQEHGALKEDEAQRLKALEQESVRLKRIIAEQALGISMLKDLTAGKW
jgi:putative transposase